MLRLLLVVICVVGLLLHILLLRLHGVLRPLLRIRLRILHRK